MTTKSTVDEAYTGWLANVKKTRAAATHEQYYYMYKAHIKPVIGGKKAAAVTQADIDKIISDMDGLAQSTKNHVKKVLRLCFTAIGLPEIVQSIVVPKSDASRRKVLTSDEADKLLMAMQGSRWLPSVEFCLESAVRVGELLALTYDDIKDGEIHITKSLYGMLYITDRTGFYSTLVRQIKEPPFCGRLFYCLLTFRFLHPGLTLRSH